MKRSNKFINNFFPFAKLLSLSLSLFASLLHMLSCCCLVRRRTTARCASAWTRSPTAARTLASRRPGTPRALASPLSKKVTDRERLRWRSLDESMTSPPHWTSRSDTTELVLIPSTPAPFLFHDQAPDQGLSAAIQKLCRATLCGSDLLGLTLSFHWGFHHRWITFFVVWLEMWYKHLPHLCLCTSIQAKCCKKGKAQTVVRLNNRCTRQANVMRVTVYDILRAFHKRSILDELKLRKKMNITKLCINQDFLQVEKWWSQIAFKRR